MIGDYRISITKAITSGVARLVDLRRPKDIAHWQTRAHQPGVWIVHCPLCKDRTQFERQDLALSYADRGHRHWLAHQRLTGLLALGLELPEVRGYDSMSSKQHPRNFRVGQDWELSGQALWLIANGKQDEVDARAREMRESRARFQARKQIYQDELASRRQPVAPPRIDWVSSPLRSVTVQWPDGRTSSGTEYDMIISGVAYETIALREGGWIINGQHVSSIGGVNRMVS